MRHGRSLVAAAVCLVGCVAAAHASPAHASPADASPADAARPAGGDIVYLPGIAPAADARAAGFARQTESVLAQMAERLRQAGMGLSRVVSATVYLTAADDLPALDAAWTKAWPADPPARTVVIGSLAEPGARLLVSAIAASPGTAIAAIKPPSWPDPPGPYSYAVKAGDTLFVSGLRPVPAGSRADATGDMAAQTTAALSQARPILEAAGLAMTDLVQSRVYITETGDFQAMNGAYRPFFPVPPPTRATVRVGHVRAGDLIVVELVAMRGERTALTTPAADGGPGQANPNYSSAIRVGRWLFTAGMLGTVPGRTTDLAAQSVETLDRLERTMKVAGHSWSDVVQCVIWVTDASLADVAAAALRDRTGGRPVVSSVVGSGLVVPGGLVEILVVTWK